MALMACLAMSLAYAEQPGKKGNSSEKKSEPNKSKSEPNKGKSEPNNPNSGPGKSPSNEPHGNYTDELSEHTQPVQGAVDPKTQRAAWTVGDNKNSVIEAGLSNLSQDEATVLIHRKGMTDHWLLVRLHQPAQRLPR